MSLTLRPTPETVGLTETTLEALRHQNYKRKDLRERIAFWGTFVIILCPALWVLFPFTNGADLRARLLVVGFASLFGWFIVWAILYGLTGLFLRQPKGYDKVEVFDQAVHKFEKDWREYYWKSFWDSIASLRCHVERPNEYPKARLGFLDLWRICEGHLFLIADGKRRVVHLVPEETTLFSKDDAGRAVNAKSFYCADLMCIVSPDGVTQEAIDYLVKDYPNQFSIQTGQQATDLINAVKANASSVWRDASRTVQDFSQSALMTWADIEMSLQKASTIAAEYGAVVEHLSKPGIRMYSESRLPYPKAEIRRAIELLLLETADNAKRNALEVGNVLLDRFVLDEDYAVVQQQTRGVSEALKKYDEGNRDVAELAETICDGTTKEGEAQLHIIQERVQRDSENTLKRNRELRQEAASRLRKNPD